MHYSAVDLHRADIWVGDRLLCSSRSTGNPMLRLLVSYFLSEQFNRLIVHFRTCVTAFWQTCFLPFYCWNDHPESPLNDLPWYNVNVRVLERLLPIIAVVIWWGSALSCVPQNVLWFIPLLPAQDNSHFYRTTKAWYVAVYEHRFLHLKIFLSEWQAVLACHQEDEGSRKREERGSNYRIMAKVLDKTETWLLYYKSLSLCPPMCSHMVEDKRMERKSSE